MTEPFVDNTKGGQEDLAALSRNAYESLSGERALQERRVKESWFKGTKDDWRSVFALIVLAGYFVLILFVIIPWWCGKDDDSVLKILGTVGSLLGSPLGFVMGHYFKDRVK